MKPSDLMRIKREEQKKQAKLARARSKKVLQRALDRDLGINKHPIPPIAINTATSTSIAPRKTKGRGQSIPSDDALLAAADRILEEKERQRNQIRDAYARALDAKVEQQRKRMQDALHAAATPVNIPLLQGSRRRYPRSGNETDNGIPSPPPPLLSSSQS